MSFRIEPFQDEDFDTISGFVLSKDGDLAAAAATVCWHAEGDESTRARYLWSLKQQRDIYANDPTAHFVKAVDTQNGNGIAAIARWHFYPDGYQDKFTPLEYLGTADPEDDGSWPEGLNKALYKAILDPLLEARRSWMGDGPYWGE